MNHKTNMKLCLHLQSWNMVQHSFDSSNREHGKCWDFHWCSCYMVLYLSFSFLLLLQNLVLRVILKLIYWFNQNYYFCSLNINGWEMMIALGFFAAARYIIVITILFIFIIKENKM